MLNFTLLSQIMRPRKFNPSESAFDRILANAADVSRGDHPVPVPVPKTKEEFNMLYLHQVLEGNYDSVCRGEGWNGGHVVARVDGKDACGAISKCFSSG
jgi:hypothetical protein